MPHDPHLTSAFIDNARKTFKTCYGKIVHCLGQMSDADVNWRPFDGANSVANVVVHLCGNVGQWVTAGVGGAAVTRDRLGEFARAIRATPAELAERLGEAYRAADAAIAAVTAETILAPRAIQGYDETVQGAVFHAVSHFEGHTHQIMYVARLRLGDRYVFKWTPSTPAQRSGPAA